MVEDDAATRALAEALLSDTELTAIGCDSAEAALTIMRERGGDVALVFADVSLAGAMDGVQLASAVALLWPAARMVVTSGRRAERPGTLPEQAVFIPKPWRPFDLLSEAEIATTGPSRSCPDPAGSPRRAAFPAASRERVTPGARLAFAEPASVPTRPRRSGVVEPLALPILSVRHLTTYRYRQPVAFGEHRIMFRPRDSYDQRLISATLKITPEPSGLRWLHDVFGNCVAVATFTGRAAQLTFECAITLDHTPESAPGLPDRRRTRRSTRSATAPTTSRTSAARWSGNTPIRATRSMPGPAASCRRPGGSAPRTCWRR